MHISQVKWQFKPLSFPPVLTIIGEIENADIIPDDYLEGIILQHVVTFLEKAEEIGGKPINPNSPPPPTRCAVITAIMFKNANDLQTYIKSIGVK